MPTNLSSAELTQKAAGYMLAAANAAKQETSRNTITKTTTTRSTVKESKSKKK